ncbi:DUF6538 domain-containing protein [Vibrio nomapromontoriensis]|uniref:DUF6538 domain-containing protein n=1 Tax=Vibrio nomapromontoriensis TaxID=2910246 RepID=UPI003D0B220D
MRYLTQRSSSGIWYFRYQIPTKFRSFFPYGREIKRSLSTRSLTTAKLRASQLQQVVWEKMELLEKHSSDGRKVIGVMPNHPPLDDGYISKYLSGLKRQTLTKLRTYIQLFERNPNLLRAQRQRLELRRNDASIPSIDIIESIYQRDANPIDIAEQIVALDDHAFDLDTLHYREDKKNIHIAMGQFYRDYQRCLDSLNLEGAKAVLKAIEEYESGTSEPLPDDFNIDECWLNQEPVHESHNTPLQSDEQLKPQVQQKESAAVAVDIEAVLKGYELEQKAKNVSSKTIEKYLRSCRLVHDLLDNSDMTRVSREDATLVLAKLKLFPKNANNGHQREHFVGLSANEIIKKNEALGFEVRKKEQPLRDMRNVSTVYKWAVLHNKLSYNPFEGLGSESSKTDGSRTMENKEGKKQKKVPFIREDLKKIFSHAVFTQGKIGRNTRENIRLNYQYWVLLIVMLTGARPNEICQLRIKDIRRVDGVLCFCIQAEDEDQSVKNDNAVRYIPIPNAVFTLGFQAYIDSVSDGRMLFPDLTYTEDSGYYGKVEDWFYKTFTKPMKLTGQNKSLYSLRHTFIFDYQMRKQSGMALKQLIGHGNGNITDDLYGGSMTIEVLKDTIEQYDVSDILKGVKPFKVATY